MDQMVLLQLLTGYIDGQLDSGATAEVETIMAQRPEMRQLVARLRHATVAVQSAIMHAPPGAAAPQRDPDCLAEQTLMRLADGTASGQERQLSEDHLARCDYCLSQIMQSVRSSRSMAKGDWPELPEETTNESIIRALIHFKEQENSDERWAQVTISAALDEPVRHVVRLRGATVRLTFSPHRRGGIALELQLQDSRRVRASREISLTNNETGRKHVTGNTDQQGVFRIARLVAGNYTIHFVGAVYKIDLTVEKEET